MSSAFSGSKVVASREVQFAGDDAGNEKFLRIQYERVEENGVTSDRYFWIRGDFVVIVAQDERGRFICVREYKHAAKEVLFGFPAGGINKKTGELPAEAALRELKEETGYVGNLQDCVVFGPYREGPDKTTARQFIVYIPNVKKEGAPTPESTEVILGVQLASLETVMRNVGIVLHLAAIYRVTDYLEAINNRVIEAKIAA